ncbi:adenosylmethionine decarboxylase [Burkholderia sp. SIMBA_062]|uniref:adenosylmethionine decarboxylase n=1 Tax=Burkholderia sp. SIMBA_062 TaxID=3085803 RepID=UPI00397964BE
MNTAGVHIIAELSDCDFSRLSDAVRVEDACKQAALHSRATVLSVNRHRFSPVGVSILVFLAESHLSVHTWPEEGYAAVDVYTCGPSTRPHKAITFLARFLKANNVHLRCLSRGKKISDREYESEEFVLEGAKLSQARAFDADAHVDFSAGRIG